MKISTLQDIDPINLRFERAPNAAAQLPVVVRPRASLDRPKSRTTDAAAPIATEQKVPAGFISVDEKLPPVGQKVAVWFAGDSAPRAWAMWLTASGAWHEDDGENASEDYFPTHWQYLSAQPAPKDDGWIEWEGGECPVDVDGKKPVEVRVQEKSGSIRESLVSLWANNCRWEHHPNGVNIIAYRLVLW